MADLRQTKEYAEYIKTLGWSVIRCQIPGVSCQVFIKKIPLIGNIAKLQRPSGRLNLQVLDEFAKQHKIAVFYIEPTSHELLVTSYEFKPARSCFLPPKTIHIDLTKSEKQFLKEMKQKTRYNIKVAQKRGVVVKESRDIEAFINLWHRSARGRGMWLSQTKEIRALWTAFGSKANVLLAYNSDMHVHSKSVLAGVLVLRTPPTTYYMYAASTQEGNGLCAPSLLVWEAIKLAKKKGCKVFDFEGIYDDRYPQTKSWKGFTKFKEGFGGKIIIYPQTLVHYDHLLLRIMGI